MAKLTKAQFAKECKIKSGNLSNYISRGKVIVKNDLIDTENEFNIAFLNKQLSKGHPSKSKEPVKSIVKPKTDPDPENPEEIDEENIPSFQASVKRLKYYDTLKRKKEIEALQITIDAKKGIVIPSELVKPIFLQHNQFIVTEFKNVADDILRVISKKHSLTVNEIADIKGQLVISINSAIKKSIQSSIKNVSNIIRDFSVKKGVGEHG